MLFRVKQARESFLSQRIRNPVATVCPVERPVLMEWIMLLYAASAQFGVDEASYYHDQFGSTVLKTRNRRANSHWIARANREVFSHDSWSRIHRREYKATPKRWGRLRGAVAAVNTAFSWAGQASLTIAGTVTFGIANMLNGTKYLDSPKKWRL